MSESWLIVTGELSPRGGMDRANHALAMYLARRGARVDLVSHRVWDDLAASPGVRVHRVAHPLGSNLLGGPLLDLAGRRYARRLAPDGTRVVVNGGNCDWGDINWVHYVHAAWEPRLIGGPLRRIKAMVGRRYDLATERAYLRRARLVVANSDRTRAELIGHLGVPEGRVHTVYYGTDPAAFRPPTDAERAEARARLSWADGDHRPAAVFVGALGDLRKGFDTLFAAWRLLARDPGWDARLIVVGVGASLPIWKARTAEAGLGDSIRFLGFRPDVPAILRACDLLVSPTRYEAFGLNVQEALCSGLPALVSASAGVAERFPDELRGLLLPDPEDAADLADRLRRWRDGVGRPCPALESFSRGLRDYTWDHMAGRIAHLAETERG